jgi:hypothetical protein
MFTFWKKARAVAETKLAIQTLLLAFQYRPFSQSEPISEMLWTDEFFAGVFYNVMRALAQTHLGRTPDPQELSDILGRAIEQATGSPQLAKAAVNTTSKAVRAPQPGDDFTNGADVGLKFIGLFLGGHAFDNEEDVKNARHASTFDPGEETDAKVSAIYASMFIRPEYMRRFVGDADL